MLTVVILSILAVTVSYGKATPKSFSWLPTLKKHLQEFEGNLPGAASPAMIDELWYHLDALNSFVLESQKKGLEKENGRVTFYNEAKEKTFQIRNSAGSCTEIEHNFQTHVNSIRVSSGCVRIHSGSNCSGKNVMLSPETPTHRVMESLGSMRSLSLCSVENFRESSSTSLKAVVTLDCRGKEALEVVVSSLK